MNVAKQQIIRMVEALPEEITVDDIMTELYFRLQAETISKKELLFYISKETVQHEAKQKIGRHLTEDELDIAKDGFDWGLMTGIDIVYDTILFEMRNDKKMMFWLILYRTYSILLMCLSSSHLFS